MRAIAGKVEFAVMVVQLSAKQALWALSRAAERVTSLAAGQMALMQELVAAMSLSNRWASFECVLFAVCVASYFPLFLQRPQWECCFVWTNMDGRLAPVI